MRRSWDVFCKVVDNYGDAAFAWRLATALVREHDADVRLVIDALAPLHALAPSVDPSTPTQRVAGIEVFDWTRVHTWFKPGDIAVDAFGCGLPEAYLEARARDARRGVWITTEYLSAEAWVAASHGLPSPHPATGLERFFFFPGFVTGTGGLPREAGYDESRTAFEALGAADTFWRSMGFTRPENEATTVSLFGYENERIGPLLAHWAAGQKEMVVGVTASRVLGDVARFTGHASKPGDVVRLGALELRFLPFLDQPGYDRLLNVCDWNFVRGEDSLVRALWAERPLVWHLYPQADLAHAAKLDAFLDWWLEEAAVGVAAPVRSFSGLWNATSATGDVAGAWDALAAGGPALARIARDRASAARQPGEFVSQLVDFCEVRLK